MQLTLNEIVSSALQNADTSMKIASDADAEPGGASDLDAILGITDEPAAAEPAAEPEPETKTASHEDILADAEYAMKLAEALDTASSVVSSKLAMDGLAVTQGEHNKASTQHPTAQTTSVPGPQKSHGGGSTEATCGTPNGIETNKADFSSPDWTKNKEAAVALLNTKVAQAEQFMEAGEVDMATQLLDEVESMHAKLAADPSSPQASLPKGGSTQGGDNSDLDTTAGAASHIPDNAGMASMTRASARDSSTREATKYFSEKPKKDNAVAAHVGKADGLKISSLVEAVEKRASSEEAPATPAEEPAEPAPPVAAPKVATIIDPGQREAARVYLQKQASMADDPNATEAEKKAAVEIINTVKARLGEEQTAELLA